MASYHFRPKISCSLKGSALYFVQGSKVIFMFQVVRNVFFLFILYDTKKSGCSSADVNSASLSVRDGNATCIRFPASFTSKSVH